MGCGFHVCARDQHLWLAKRNGGQAGLVRKMGAIDCSQNGSASTDRIVTHAPNGNIATVRQIGGRRVKRHSSQPASINENGSDGYGWRSTQGLPLPRSGSPT